MPNHEIAHEPLVSFEKVNMAGVLSMELACLNVYVPKYQAAVMVDGGEQALLSGILIKYKYLPCLWLAFCIILVVFSC